MMISGDADQNCNPLHARKMTARLQAANVSGHPIVLDYSRYRGHSPVLPLSERWKRSPTEWRFFATSCGCLCEVEDIPRCLFSLLRAYLRLVQFDFYLAMREFPCVVRQRCGVIRSQQHTCGQLGGIGLRRSRHGLYLVLERSALPTALRGNRVLAEAIRRACTNDDWRPADAVQGTRVGRSRRPRGQ